MFWDVGALVLALGLVAATTAVTTVLLRPVGRADAASTAGVVALALVSTAVLVTGALGVLRAPALLGVHALQASLALAVVVRRGGWQVPRPTWRRPEWRRPGWESLLVALAVLALGWQLLVALVLPPFDYDGLSYHLTTVAAWVQSESLAPSPMTPCCAYYPFNAELPSAWLVVLVGSDALVGTVQVAAAALAGAAVAAIARTAGLSRRGAVAAGALFVLTPALLAQAPTSYVDVLLAALVLAGLQGLARYAVDARAVRLVVPALCAGLLSGTKGTGLLWAAALVAVTAVVGIVHVRRSRARPAGVLASVAGTAAACAALGGGWYVRSLAATGNPFHPVEITVAGRTLFPGPLQLDAVLTPAPAGEDRPWPVAVLRSWASALLPWRVGSYDYQQLSGGLGPLWAWLGAPLLLLLALHLWRTRSAALTVLVPVLAMLLVQPYRWWARFTLPLAALGVLAVVVAVERSRPVLLRRGLQAASTVLVLAGAALVLVEVDPASRAEPLPASRVLSLVGAPAEQRTLGRLVLPEYRFLDDVPSDALVLYDLEVPPLRFVYPLYGQSLGRTVVAASAGPVADDAWVITSRGRPLDAQAARTRSAPVSDVDGVRVWAPVAGEGRR